MDKLNEEFKRFVERIIGKDLEDEDIGISPEKIGGERILAFFKSINDFLDISNELGREILQNLPQNANLMDFLEKARKVGLRKAEEDPEMIKLIQNSIDVIKDTLFSVEFHKELFTAPTEDSFEQQLKNIFLQELESAEKISKNAIVKSFKLAINSIKRKQKPDQLFLMSNYQELGLPLIDLETDKIIDIVMNIFHSILTKKQNLFKLSDERLIDVIVDFTSRLGRAIEPYIKTIFVSILNLSQVRLKRRFFDFKEGLGFYFNMLNINRSNTEDYLDFRNAIKHDDFDVLIDRSIESIKLSFKIKRESRGKIERKKEVIMTLGEFEQFFRRFRKFQNSFFYFYEIYIKNLENSYEFQFFPL